MRPGLSRPGLALALAVSAWGDASLICESAWEGVPVQAIRLQGLRHTRESVVMRRLVTRTGRPYACADLQKDGDRLRDLDVFAHVSVSAARDSSGLVLAYQFRELPPYVPYVSMAKTDQDGFSAGPAVAALNLLGTGAHLELASRFGGTTEIYGSLSGLEIGAFPLEYDFLVSHVDSWNSLQDFHENSWRLKWDMKRPLIASWLAVGAAEFMYLEADRPDLTLLSHGDALPRLGLGLAWDKRNRRKLPVRGYYAEARWGQTGGFLGGPADFQEILLDLRAYQPVGKKQIIAVNYLHRWRQGKMGSYDLFRAGGANSLRGYPHGAETGKSESILFIEDRLLLLPQRSLPVWNWAIPLAIEGVCGVEILRSWDHSAPFEAQGPEAIYVGVHILTGGLDRIRLEGGSNISRFSPNFDVGFFDKADAQRFRTR